MADRQPRILVIGSLNLDLVLKVSHMPHAGETLASEASATFCGGKGANQAVACARMGAGVSMIGRVGDDPAGHALRQALIDEGIECRGLAATPGAASGGAVILLTADGQNRIVLALGANALLSPADIAAQAGLFAQADIVVCQLETPLDAVEAAVTHAVARGVPILLNPAPARPLPDELLVRVDYLVPNETEAMLLTGIRVENDETACEAAQALRLRGAACVVVTRGASGITIADRNGCRHRPAYAGEVVDTTAAGDGFVGGFAVGIAEGLATDEAADLGQRVAGISVGRPGAQASLPRRREL